MEKRLRTLRIATRIFSIGALIQFLILTYLVNDATISQRIQQLVIFTVQNALTLGGEIVCKKNCLISFLLVICGILTISIIL